MVDIIREAEEDLEREKLQNLWNKWGRYVLAACAGIVLGTAGITGYDAWELSRSHKATAKILDVVNPQLGGVTSTEPLLEKAAELPADQAAIARFIAVGDLLRSDKKEEASETLRSIESDSGVQKVLRNLARVQLAALYVSDPDKTSEDVSALLEPILGNTNDSWFAQAKINMALALAHKDQNYVEASKNLEQLLEKQDAPLAIREQAIKLKDLYSIKAADQTRN